MTNMPAGISAESYDEYVNNFTKPWNDYLIERLVEEAEQFARPPKCIVDVGTGTARTLVEIATMPIFDNCKLIGLDFFPEMIKQAQQNVITNGLQDRIEIMHGDVHAMNIPDNSTDLIFGRSVIHHWANPKNAYLEIFRILTPGGACIIHEPSSQPSVLALESFNVLRSEFGAPAMSISEKFTADQVREQLKAAGLENAATVYQGEGLASLGFELRITKPLS